MEQTIDAIAADTNGYLATGGNITTALNSLTDVVGGIPDEDMTTETLTMVQECLQSIMKMGGLPASSLNLPALESSGSINKQVVLESIGEWASKTGKAMYEATAAAIKKVIQFIRDMISKIASMFTGSKVSEETAQKYDEKKAPKATYRSTSAKHDNTKNTTGKHADIPERESSNYQPAKPDGTLRIAAEPVAEVALTKHQAIYMSKYDLVTGSEKVIAFLKETIAVAAKNHQAYVSANDAIKGGTDPISVPLVLNSPSLHAKPFNNSKPGDWYHKFYDDTLPGSQVLVYHIPNDDKKNALANNVSYYDFRFDYDHDRISTIKDGTVFNAPSKNDIAKAVANTTKAMELFKQLSADSLKYTTYFNKDWEAVRNKVASYDQGQTDALSRICTHNLFFVHTRTLQWAHDTIRTQEGLIAAFCSNIE